MTPQRGDQKRRRDVVAQVVQSREADECEVSQDDAGQQLAEDRWLTETSGHASRPATLPQRTTRAGGSPLSKVEG
jgi:hypothetical protein